ncbi:hypothetical protein LJC15_04825 [Desulfovibrio sp. OttesenSCG-928-G11]|nr:hypothetical protein [Desulfovibrio sp. OttesenSCG-928-G11]
MNRAEKPHLTACRGNNSGCLSRRGWLMNNSAMKDRKRLEEADYFLKCLQALGKISQHDQVKAGSSAIVTLADAATICGISAQELWLNYVRLGTLRMYNGDVPASDFINVTILLHDVIAFFCEQERIRRRYEQSYQTTVKYIVDNRLGHYNNLCMSSYFRMSESDAIRFESTAIALSRFFILNPIETINVSCNVENNINNANINANINANTNTNTNTNNIVIENNIDLDGLAQILKDIVEAVPHGTEKREAVSAGAPTVEKPTATKNQHRGSNEQRDKIDATAAVCLVVISAIMGRSHLDDDGKINRNRFEALVREAMTAKGQGDLYHATTAKNKFDNSPELTPFKRQVGRPENKQ